MKKQIFEGFGEESYVKAVMPNGLEIYIICHHPFLLVKVCIQCVALRLLRHKPHRFVLRLIYLALLLQERGVYPLQFFKKFYKKIKGLCEASLKAC